MTTEQTRIRAALGFRKTDVPAVLSHSKVIYNSVNGAPTVYPSPNPTMPTFLGGITALDQSEQVATGTRARGSASARNVKRDALWTLLEILVKYVQSLADASPEQAVSLIEGASLVVAKSPTHAKPVLAAILSALSGSLILRANATLLKAGRGKAKKTTFNWRSSADGGKTWIAAPSSPLAKTTIAGLTPTTTYEFQVSVTDSGGTGEWSQAVSLQVK